LRLISKCKWWRKSHDYEVVEELGYSCQKLRCKKCGKFFGINHSVRQILDWDYELEEMTKYLK
jgi:hypothetical protein